MDSQRQVFDKLAAMNELATFASIVYDTASEENIKRILKAKISMISAGDPQTEKAVLNYFFKDDPEI
jgi:hypothetical protein